MNTNNFKKYYCLYTSDYHLEMILLPYIKRNIDETNFIILTENDLSKTVNFLLNKTNLSLDNKKKILNIDWNEKDLKNYSNVVSPNSTIIINGSTSYLEEFKKKNIIDDANFIYCYNIVNEKLEHSNFQDEYDGILNTTPL